MQKQKENQFLDKFSLLNSQEHTEEIIWSLSDSSEYEEPSISEKLNNISNRTRILKRKRKKASNKLSNLSITVLDTSKSSKEVKRGDTSPILMCKKQKSFQLSPILPSTQAGRFYTSPVLSSKSVCLQSPILASKINSPKPAGKIKKKLFDKHDGLTQDVNEVKKELESDCILDDDNLTCKSSISESGSKENTSKAKSELISKIKSFFDNHFSSESPSQNSESISDIQTPRTNNNDDVEILSCKTQMASITSIKTTRDETPSDHSPDYYTFNKGKKKNRYKKDGLAFRLNNLLRKQNACLSLWQHERFLAANSNFVIPKGEYTVFRIQKVHFKYGCYLLEAVDLHEDRYLVLINSFYVTDNIISDTIIKVYEPFRIVQYNIDTKLIINVSRFECSQYLA